MVRQFMLAACATTLMLTSTLTMAATMTGFDFTFAGFDGKPLPLEQYRGKPVLVVNTASECGYTGQYAGLEKLWQDYKDKGLVVIGVPSNNFGGQEPLKGEEIQNFCKLNYGVTFPLADRTDVRGSNEHPFYKWAEQQAGKAAVPTWNFHKILVGPDGGVSATFATAVDPTAPEIRTAIETALTLSGS